MDHFVKRKKSLILMGVPYFSGAMRGSSINAFGSSFDPSVGRHKGEFDLDLFSSGNIKHAGWLDTGRRALIPRKEM